MYQQKVNNWTKLWEHNLKKEAIEWINKKEIKSGIVYPNVKMHKEILHTNLLFQLKKLLFRI